MLDGEELYIYSPFTGLGISIDETHEMNNILRMDQIQNGIMCRICGYRFNTEQRIPYQGVVEVHYSTVKAMSMHIFGYFRTDSVATVLLPLP